MLKYTFFRICISRKAKTKATAHNRLANRQAIFFKYRTDRKTVKSRSVSHEISRRSFLQIMHTGVGV